MRILLFGPYGGHNLGDEFILNRIAGDICRLGHEPIATSTSPRDTERLHGIEAWPALDLRRGERRLLSRLPEVDGVVVGGGEQIFESKWKNPLWGLLPNLAHLMAATTQAGLPVMYWSIGASPTSPIGDWMIRRWVARADVITVRDERSLHRLEAHGMRHPQLRLAADPVFEVPRRSHQEARASLARQYPQAAGGPLILVVAANDRRRSLDYTPPLLAGARMAAASLGGQVLVLLTDHQPRYDQVLLRRPEFQPDARLQVVPQSDFSADQLTELFAAVDVVISARMHPLIIAATQGTPWLNLGGNSKLEALGVTFDQPTVRIDGSTSYAASTAVEEVFVRIRTAVADGRASWQERTDPALGHVRARAGQAREAFLDVFPPARSTEVAS